MAVALVTAHPACDLLAVAVLAVKVAAAHQIYVLACALSLAYHHPRRVVSHPQRCRCLIISDVVVLALVLSIALALTFVIGPISSRHDLRTGGAGQTARQRSI